MLRAELTISKGMPARSAASSDVFYIASIWAGLNSPAFGGSYFFRSRHISRD
jgi:hypothetical protein